MELKKVLVPVDGSPVAETILPFIEQIADGDHRWSGLLCWVLGSAAQRVIRTAPCPVLTIGPERPEGGILPWGLKCRSCKTRSASS